jgi:Carboxypeptidase regulatory-like domain
MWRLSPVFLLALAAHAQTVDGTLIASITQTPIANVVVTLLGQTRYDALTDETGAFHFPKVVPGEYFLNIVKAGYVLPTSRSGPFHVDTDTRLSVDMDPLGRIEGRVRYPEGKPAPRGKVTLDGEGHHYTADADPDGRFLLEDLVAGSYILRATATGVDAKPDGEIWAPTYFPSTIDRDAAEPIPVINGLTATREVRLRSVPARRIRGTVRDETGELAAGVSVRLEDRTVVTTADGIFEFVVRDGEWRLTAVRKDAGVERRGVTTVFVSRHDVENVDIRLVLPFSVPLAVEGDKDTPAPGQPHMPQMMISLVGGMSQFLQANPDGIPNVYPGRYTILVVNRFPKSYVESIRLGDVEVSDRPFDLWDGSLPIRITMRQGAASIHGNVENASAGAVVVLDAGANVTTKLPNTYSFSNSRFDVGPLRPGDYYVFAVNRPAPLSLTEPILNAFLQRAEKVHLDKGGAAVMTLKAVPWPY